MLRTIIIALQQSRKKAWKDQGLRNNKISQIKKIKSKELPQSKKKNKIQVKQSPQKNYGDLGQPSLSTHTRNYGLGMLLHACFEALHFVIQ